jgi:hypothetical protein
MFPYFVTDESKGYIFSALDCPCSKEDFKIALGNETISQEYHDLLIGNLWNAETGEKPAYFAAV